MKKVNVLIYGLLLIICNFYSCDNEYEYGKVRYKGQVKSVTCRVCNVGEKFGKWIEGNQYFYSEYHYDTKGFYTEINVNETKIIPKYDKNKLIEESSYNKDGEILEISKIRYISKTEKEITKFDSEGKKIYTISLFYKGKLLEKSIFMDKTRTVVTNTYDKNENISESVQITDKETYTTGSYDEFGNGIVKDTTVFNKKRVKKYEYLEYDIKGNWLKRLVYSDSDIPSSIEINEISYYDNFFSKIFSIFKKNKLQQKDAERAIKRFMDDNEFDGGGWNQTYSFNANAINIIDPINQFDKKQANVVVHYDIREPFANDDLVLKFIFKENVENKWFLTSVESVQGIGTETLSSKIKKWNDLNICVQ